MRTLRLLAIGIVYTGLGVGLVRYFELQSRRLASLERI